MVSCMGYDADGKLIAYARLIPKGVSYENFASMGRIATAASVRRTGAGRALMKVAMDEMAQQFSGDSIKISAQTYLREFYESYGFVVSGDEYLEDGIPHFPMVC